MTILVIDDSPMMRRMVTDAGAILGANVLEADGADAALALLEDQGACVALIVLDWNMPGMNGIELLKVIKANTRWAHIPVIMASTEDAPERIVEAIRTGAENYLIKPYRPKDLVLKIRQAQA